MSDTPKQLRAAAAVIAGDVLTVRRILDAQLINDGRYIEALATVANGARSLADLASALERGEPSPREAAAAPVVFGDMTDGELLGRGAQ
jgi:hypothetical protein